MQFFPYSGLYLSIFPSVRATIFVYLPNEKFLSPATFFQITILIFQNDKFPFLCLGLNIRLKVVLHFVIQRDIISKFPLRCPREIVLFIERKIG